MSTEVQTELERIESNVAAAYAAAEEQGADMPAAQNTENLPETVASIKSVKFTEQALDEAQQSQARTNIGAASQEDVDKLSSEKVNQEELETAVEAAVVDELVKREQLSPEFASSIEECTDTTKLYVLPDGYIYAYMLTEVESGPAYTNVLPAATMGDDQATGWVEGKGYTQNARLSGSGGNVITNYTGVTGFGVSGYITGLKVDDVIRIKGFYAPDGASSYIVSYNGTAKVNNQTFNPANNTMSGDGTWQWTEGADWYTIDKLAPVEEVTATIELTSENFGSDFNAIRLSGIITENTIVTINEEIVEGSGTTTEYAWVSTGLAFVPADYEDRIIELEEQVTENTSDIANLKKGIISATAIKDWDAPIYDANIPVFELSAEKAAMTNATNTPDNIYAMYDALMAKHPKYITKTDLGLCSDGVNHVYRYDFREPEPLHESNKVWSETKTKAIIVTGIHYEWAGIYAMYNALEEIADNPELRHFRRNTHLIVIPVANPYATIADNYQSGLTTPNSYGVRNANGVEIHRNFEVDWVLTEEGTTHYGGAEPLSEVETQYIDQIMKDNTDAALFLSAHNCGVDTFWGTGFIWSSTATKYMCNMGYRLVDKLSDAWMDKYGDILSAGIEEYKTDLLEDGDTRLGWAGLSTSPGTEAKQATKYGIQGTNIETCDPFQIHGTADDPEPSMSEFTMSRGAEVYVNFLLTAFGVYDAKDKQLYASN